MTDLEKLKLLKAHEEKEQEKGTWTFLVPITKLELTEAVNFEFKVDRVTFVSTDKLPRRKKKFGIPNHIADSRLRKKLMIDKFFSESSCFATLRKTGKLKEIERPVLEMVREELSILTLSQLGYARRGNMATPYISDENSMSSTSYYATNLKSGDGSQPNRALGTPHSLFLHYGWKKFNKKKGFFFDLLKILRGEIKVDKEWQNNLRNAAILVGLSQTSLDLPQAFLNNMIALELLLTKQGDKVNETLPTRAEAFLGWTGFWAVENFADRIQKIYSIRCKLVHQGERDLIKRKDLLFTDDLLFNLLVNIVGHHRIFSNKESIIEFSNKVQAEHLLGVKPKTRPKTLHYVHKYYTERDFED